jgi:hypothetical protein
MKQRLLAAISGIDRLNQRDRMALAGGVLAALVGFEMVIVMPMQTKRQAIERSVSAESDSLSGAQQAAQAERAQRLAELSTRTDELEKKLAALGLNEVQRDSLAGFLARSLHNQGVALTGVRGLPVETLSVATVASEAEAAAAAAPPASPAAAPAPPANVTLFRHRAELKLEGPVTSLTKAIDALERELAPLRIENVLLSAGPAGAPVQAVLIVTTISQERTWLGL